MGLRRHQVENLVLRGPIFYWRARIPVGFRGTGTNARLSLSLRLSDRKKASLVARRLNAMLLELEMVPKARMATKEQLAKIFALEAEAMRAEIEALDLAAKRTGTLRDSEHREADRQVGWAYRLLHTFGSGEDVSFAEGSETREALIEAGAQADDIPFIEAAYRSEREITNSDRKGVTRSPFLRDVLHRMRALSPAALRAESKRRADEAAASGEKIELGLSRATIRRHLGNLDHFLKHLRASHFTVPEWTFEGLRPKKPPKGEIRLQQVKPKPEDIRPLFDIPFFTGRRSVEEPEVAGDLVFHSANYYLPMLFTYLGSRRKEFAGLMVDEIVQSDGHWSIQIKASEVRRIKNAQSHRLLPVPNELLRLNFIEYVERLKEVGHKMLFPELFSPYLQKSDPGDRFYKDFVPIAKKCMPGGLWQRPIHALRHGFANTLKQAGVSDGVIEDISGRLGETETATRYTNPAGLSLNRR